MFIFANFVQSVNFKLSYFKKVGAAFSEFYLFILSLLRVLGGSSFKALQVPLDEYIYH